METSEKEWIEQELRGLQTLQAVVGGCDVIEEAIEGTWFCDNCKRLHGNRLSECPCSETERLAMNKTEIIEVAQITSKDGRMFFSADHGAELMAQIMRRLEWRMIVLIPMTRRAYQSIPATQEAAELFKLPSQTEVATVGLTYDETVEVVRTHEQIAKENTK